MKNFKEWLINLEESLTGNLAALAGMALGHGGTANQAQPAPQNIMAQQFTPIKFGVPVSMTEKKAKYFIDTAKKALKDLEFFQAHIAPNIQNIRKFYKPGEQVGKNQYSMEEYEVNSMGHDIQPTLTHWMDQYRVLAGLTPDQLVKAYSFSVDAEDQKTLNNIVYGIERDLITPFTKIKDLGPIQLLSKYEIAGNEDPRSEEDKALQNFAGRFSNYIETILKLHHDSGYQSNALFDDILEKIEKYKNNDRNRKFVNKQKPG